MADSFTLQKFDALMKSNKAPGPINDDFYSNEQGGAVSPRQLSDASGKASNGYMAKLGNYMFSLDTAAFQQLQRTTEYRWGAINRIGRKQANQFLGQGTDSIKLTGVIYPHFRGGIKQIGAMRAEAGNGKPMSLVYAFEQVGQYCQQWCIRSIEEGRTEFFKDGLPRKIEFTIELVAYGEDMDNGASVLNLIPAAATINTFAPPPAMFGGAAAGLTDAAKDTANLKDVTKDSKLSDLQKVTANARKTAAGITGAVTSARTTISNTLNGAREAVVQYIDPSVMSAAREIGSTAGDIMQTVGAAKATINVVKDSPNAVKTTVKGAGQDMAGYGRNVGELASTIKASSIEQGRVSQTSMESAANSGVASADRLEAAATVANLDRAADGMRFTTREGERQFNAEAGKINVPSNISTLPQ